MLTLREAFEIAQVDYPNACKAAFPRLRQLAQNGQIDEEIFRVVIFVADRRYFRSSFA